MLIGSSWRALALAVIAGGFGAAMVSCAGGGEPYAGEDVYAGPPVSLESSRGVWVVVVQSPTGGWSVAVDRVTESRRRKDVFVTLRRPDPRFMNTQAVIEQRVATPVRSDEPVRVCVRVLDHDEDPDSRAYPVVLERAGAGGAGEVRGGGGGGGGGGGA
ncbi:MAG: protease complex subunit PrcB family protein [Phycisphaeraceae bacterium]|nr:MAG: protease complex subunit PrcB family protein [Phycisphaeraceae bacterium]